MVGARGRRRRRRRHGARFTRWVAAVVATAILLTGCAAASVMGHRGTGAAQSAGRVATATGDERRGLAVRLAYPTPGAADPAQNFGDLYLPAQARTAALVVLFHGGGWQHALGGLSGLAPLARTLAAHGVAVFNVEYRRVGSGGGWPTTFTDAAAVADFGVALHHSYPQLAGGPTILVGHSAGGQLAVWASQHQQRHAAAVVSIAGPLDLTYAALHGDRHVLTLLGGSPAQVDARYAAADPSRDRDLTTPVFLVQGTRDRVVPISFARHYLEDLRHARRVPTMIEIDGATHTSLVIPGRRGFDQTIGVIEQAVMGAAGSTSR